MKYHWGQKKVNVLIGESKLLDVGVLLNSIVTTLYSREYPLHPVSIGRFLSGLLTNNLHQVSYIHLFTMKEVLRTVESFAASKKFYCCFAHVQGWGE